MLEKSPLGYSGTWIKRFASHCYKQRGITLSDEEMSKLGEIISRFTPKTNITHYFEIAKAFTWKPGAFMESPNSCWWSSYDSSRMGMIKDPRGYAVLFYDSETKYTNESKKYGIGRCWLINEPDYGIIFNAYGISLPVIANCLSSALGLTYKSITLTSPNSFINMGNLNNEEGRGGNEGVGYILAKDVNKFKSSIDIGDIRARDTTCKECGEEIFKKDNIKLLNGYVCRSCCADLYFRCNICSEYTPNLTKTKIWDSQANCHRSCCPRCEQVRANYTCEVHGICMRSTYKIWHTSKHYCSTCLAEGIFQECAGCNHYVTNYGKISTGSRRALCFCKSCFNKIKVMEIEKHD